MNRRQKLVQQQFLNDEARIIKRLEYIYDRALFDINAKIRDLDFRIGDLTMAYEWMDDLDPEKARIKSLIQSKIYQKQYQEQLQSQIQGILAKMQTEQYLTVSDYLDGCYTDGFIGSMFDLHGQGIPLVMPINQESMVRAVQLESKISQGLYTRLGEDVGLLQNKIAAEVTRGISSGVSWEQLARQLANQTRIGYNRAVRITRTEGHRIQNQAAMDVAINAKDMGADVLKQWDATLDGKTRPSHRRVDGELREVDEDFSNGLTFPGDPDGRAAEVVNCRCALLQRARWAVEGGFTKYNAFTRQLETFDSPQDYEEFKKGFFSEENVKYVNYVQKMEQKYGTKDFVRVLGEMSDEEYDRYSKLLTDNPVYNKDASEVVAVVPPVDTDNIVDITPLLNSEDVNDIPSITAKMAELDERMDDTIDFAEMVRISEEQEALRERLKILQAMQTEGEKKRIVSEAEELVRSNGLFRKVSLEGCDAESAQAILSATEKVHTRYPDASFRSLRISKTDTHGFRDADATSLGQTAGTNIRFNGTRFGDSARLSEFLAHEKESGWTVSGTIEGIVSHEYGHAICDFYGISSFDIYQTVIKDAGLDPKKARGGLDEESYLAFKKVSNYGEVNLDEWFAECFSSVMTMENPPDISVRVVSAFDRMIRNKR